MNKYGKVAIYAAKLIQEDSIIDPRDAWRIAGAYFELSESEICKSCPKNSFLGLCEEGLINKVKIKKYTSSIKNKKYALQAVLILRIKSELSDNPLTLWDAVLTSLKQSKIQHNNQMSVVIALWNEGLIKER